YARVVGSSPCGGTVLFFFSSRRRHTRFSRDWSSDVCSSDLCDPHRIPMVLRLANKRNSVAGQSSERLHLRRPPVLWRRGLCAPSLQDVLHDFLAVFKRRVNPFVNGSFGQ